jgi:cation:H+ antiporter
MDLPALGLLSAGLVTLLIGAEALVRGASRLSLALGISPLLIGLTVVAVGTGSPELAVTVRATLTHRPDLALGNVIGSNIMNVLLVLGVGALITPLHVAQQLVRLDVPLLIGASVLLLLMALSGTIGRVDGIVLLTGTVMYWIFAIRTERAETQDVKAEYEEEFGEGDHPRHVSSARQILWITGGLVALVLGSEWMVDGATVIATTFGVSELIIGLTVVAAGTSLPELATTVVACLRGERDIAVGNVVGSCLFNILGIVGVAGVLSPDGVAVAPAAVRFDIPVMVATAVACLPIFLTGHVISRWEGALFLGYYAAYVAYLIMDAVGHDALPTLSGIMMTFVVPLTAVTLTILAARSLRSSNHDDDHAPRRPPGDGGPEGNVSSVRPHKLGA